MKEHELPEKLPIDHDAKLQCRAMRDLVEIFMGTDPVSEDLEHQKTMAIFHSYMSGGRVTVEQEAWAARC